jgi:chromatin remodeling complex protein RSC6
MPKATKSSAPAVEAAAPVAAPVKEVSSKSKKAPKEVAAAPAAVVAPVVQEVAAVVGEDSDFSNRFTSLLEKLSTIQNEWRDVQTEIKKLQKDIVKQMKESTKVNNKKKAAKVVNADKPKRNPSGFAKPAALSKELCDFLKQPYGTEMARTDVTKFLTKYIKEHSLQQESDKRIIKPDAPLYKLLGLTNESEQITYFNLQKYMKPHFPKEVVAA